MVSAGAGQPFMALVEAVPAGAVGTTLGFTMIDSDGFVLIDHTLTDIIDLGGGVARYTAAVAPDTVGSYVLQWDLAGNPVASEILQVTAVGEFAPSVDDVAVLLRARTNVMGTEIGVFNADTRPTDVQVAVLLQTAIADLQARVDVEILAQYTEDARRLAALQAATLVEASFFPDQLNTDRSAHRQYTAMYLAGVEKLVEAATRPSSLRLA